jgi:hypothetical protein
LDGAISSYHDLSTAKSASFVTQFEVCQKSGKADQKACQDQYNSCNLTVAGKKKLDNRLKLLFITHYQTS